MKASRRSIWTRISMIVLALACGLGVRVYGFAGGTGEPNNPYQIATGADLLSIGSDHALLKKHFVLVNDLDLDPNLPGGRVFDDALMARDQYNGVSGHSGDPFSGVLDGRGHTIRNLWISGKLGYDAGLFGMLSGLVKDLRLQEVWISGTPCGALAGLNEQGVILRCSVTGQLSGSEKTGGIVGESWDGVLMDCQAEVHVTGVKCVGGLFGGGAGGTLIRCESQGDVRGDSGVGGLVGELQYGSILDSRGRGTVTGKDTVGGLVGNMMMAGSIMRSVADCDVTAALTAGGLVGKAALFAARGPLITDCYARGSVAGVVAGGLIGNASGVRVVSSYAACEIIPMPSKGSTLLPAAGGLLGDADIKQPPLVTACLWDTQLSSIRAGAGSGAVTYGTGLTAQQMQQPDTFQQAGWDFDSTWAMSEKGYPILRWELAAGVESKPQE
jgi:hypothetical protein